MAGGALVLLCYLIGLTYVAKQENLTRGPEPLAARLPRRRRFCTRGGRFSDAGAGAVLYVAFLGWVVFAVACWCARRRDIRRAVVSLIAGISLLDALLIAGAGDPARAVWAVVGFVLTLGPSALGAGDLAGSRWRAAAAGRILRGPLTRRTP